LQTDLDRLGDWAGGNEMEKIRIEVRLYESPGEGSAKLFPWGPKDS